MYRYGLYIIQQLTVSTLLVTFSLTSIVWLAQALRFVDYIVNRGISILTFLHLTVLLIPSLLMVVLPFALIVSVLYVYHKLMQESELVVLQGAGLSRWQLARPAIQFALLVMIISYSITLYFLPVTYNRFRELQYFLRDNYASLLLQEEVFNSPVEGLTVFLRARDKNDVLHGILVHDSRVPGQPVTMMAQEGTLVKTAQGPRFMLRSGNRQEMREGKLSVLDFDSYALDIGFYSTKQRTRTPNPQELSLPELLRFNSADDDGLTNQMRAEAHHRIIWPLYAPALTMVALGLLMSVEFNRRMRWYRIALAVVLCVLFLAAALGMESSAAKLPEAKWLMYATLITAMVLGLKLLTWERRRARPAFPGAIEGA